MAQIVHETCIVLRRRSYRETSLLLELLTSESRYVHAIYQGAKRKGSEAVDLISEYAMSWRDRPDLLTLRSCEPGRGFEIAGTALYAAMYLNELIRHGVRQNQIVTGLYAVYRQALSELEDAGKEIESVLRRFEKAFLKVLGYEVVFNHELVNGNAINATNRYIFEPSRGFLKTEEWLSKSYDGQALLAINEDDFSESDTRSAAKIILRDALRTHVGPKPFQASKLLTASRYRDVALEEEMNG